MGGVKCNPTSTEITYFGSKFLAAIMYDASTQEFSLEYNPDMMKKEGWTLKNVVASLEHELGHILCNHFARQEDREPLRWNIAADYALDQHIKNVAWRTDEEIRMLQTQFKDMTAEEIYWKLPRDPKQIPKTIFVMVNSKGQQTCPKCGGSGKQPCPDCKGQKQVECDNCQGTGEKDGKKCEDCQGSGKKDCPTCGGQGQLDQPCDMCQGKGTVQNQPVMLPREEVRGAIDKLVQESTGQELKDISYGDQPGIWGTIRKSIESHEVDWKLIPKFLASMRDKRQRTLKRPSKRFPSPWGMRKRYEPKMTIAIDCSGSIDDMELDSFIAEVDRYTMITGEIHLVFCDCTVQKTVERYKAHQNLGTIPGRGGTDYDPALTYIEKTWRDTDLIVYLTDGECHPPRRKYRIPIVWIVTRNFNLEVKPMIRAPGLSKRANRGY